MQILHFTVKCLTKYFKEITKSNIDRKFDYFKSLTVCLNLN